MWETFVDFDNSHRMVYLQKLYSVTLAYFLKVKNLNFNISQTVRASAKMHGTTFKDLDICERMMPFRKLHILTLIYFFKEKIEILISRKR